MRVAERIYRLVLRLYPRPFRDRFGEEMALEFRRLSGGERPGRRSPASDRDPGRFHALFRGYWDLLAGLARERLRRDRRDDRASRTSGGAGPSGRGPYTPSRAAGRLVGSWLRDLRYGIRGLLKAPLFTVIAAGSLALGIGANTAVFSVANALLLRPLPGIGNGDRVVELGRSRDGAGFDTFAWPDYLDLSAQVPALAATAAYSLEMLSVAQDGAGIRASGIVVTPSYFEVLGTEPAQGRYFTAEEEVGFGAHAVAVVSDLFWRNQLGADPEVVGSEIFLNRMPYTVVGVTPPEFRGHIVALEPDVFVPMVQAPLMGANEDDFTNRGASWHQALGLLAEGATLDGLNSQLAAAGERLQEAYPGTNRARSFRAMALGPIPGGGREGVRLFMTALLAMVALVLLVTCTNVAGMFLARATAREREIGIRRALGAGRGQLVQQFTTETLLVFLLGGGVGLAMALWAVGLIRLDALPIPVTLRFDVAPDLTVITFAVAITLLTGIFFGLLPAVRATGLDVVRTLKDEGRGGGRQSNRMRVILAGTQVGLTLILLATAGLFVRSLQRAAAIDSGFDPESAYTVYLDLALEGYDDANGPLFQASLLDALRSEGWVEGASISADLPLDLSRASSVAVPDDWEPSDDEPYLNVDINNVHPGYFETLRIPLAQGRYFSAADGASEARVAVVSRAFTRRAWGDGEAVGRSFSFGLGDGSGPVYRIIGVVADVKNQLITDTPEPMVYLLGSQRYSAASQLVVRTPIAPGEAPRRIREAILAVDPSLSLGQVASLEKYTSVSVLPQRIAAWLTTGLGALALLLSGLGIYGVVSFGVARREREIGIRMALGADRRAVLTRVLRGGAVLALPGMVIGIGCSLLVGRLLESLLLDLPPYDPVALGGVSAVLLGVVVLAAWIPARRAALTDPAESLRSE